MKTIKYTRINSMPQYNEYCDRHEELSYLNSKETNDEMELIELLLDDYEKRENSRPMKDLNPVQLLKSIIEDEGISQSDLAKELNTSKQLISDILNYRRNISKEMVIKLVRQARNITPHILVLFHLHFVEEPFIWLRPKSGTFASFR